MKKYMDYVNALAIENVKQQGDPFGACVVYEGKIIAEGTNEMHLRNDVSAHAEMIAIVKAQAYLGRTDLSDCILVASGHPCPMCMGAIGFANLKEVYYGNSLEETKAAGLGLSTDIYDYIKGNSNTLGLEVKQFKVVENDPMLYFIEAKKGL